MIPTIIRVSALPTYHDCPRRSASRLFWREITDAGFRLRYLARGIGAVVGSAVHRGAAYMLEHKARTGALGSCHDAIEVSRDMLEEQVEGVEVLFDPPNGQTHNMTDAIDATVKMTATYYERVAPQIQPIRVEERLEAEIEPGLILSGQPDQVCREPDAIRDLKTGARIPAAFAPQLGGYSLLARTHGLPIERASIDYVARVKRGKPQPIPVTREAVIAHAETAASNVLRSIAADIETFRTGDQRRRILPGDPWAFAANPASMLCSPKYCAAFGTEFCHEGQRNDGSR